jgi:hypothetical protein
MGESRSVDKYGHDLTMKLLTSTLGYQGGRRTRCTDKFVRYPYPKNIGSEYQKDFCHASKVNAKDLTGEAFNLEKEAKIINPHRMDMNTTSKNFYKQFNVKPSKPAP